MQELLAQARRSKDTGGEGQWDTVTDELAAAAKAAARLVRITTSVSPLPRRHTMSRRVMSRHVHAPQRAFSCGQVWRSEQKEQRARQTSDWDKNLDKGRTKKVKAKDEEGSEAASGAAQGNFFQAAQEEMARAREAGCHHQSAHQQNL